MELDDYKVPFWSEELQVYAIGIDKILHMGT